MKVIASQDIGDLGPTKGTPVVYDWKWYYNAPGLTSRMLWLVLIPAIVLIKANRNPRALLVLIPLLIVNLLWFVVKKTIPLNSYTMAMFDQIFVSLTVGIAVLWLLAHKLGNRNRFVTFLLALVVMAVVGLAGAVAYSRGEFSQGTVAFIIMLAVLVFVMLLGFVLTGWCCRKRYSGVRFMLWLAVWTIVASIVLGCVGIVLVTGISESAPSVWALMLLQVLIAVVILGILINLPYMILALCSSFFRERFYACFRLQSMPTEDRGQKTVDVDSFEF